MPRISRRKEFSGEFSSGFSSNRGGFYRPVFLFGPSYRYGQHRRGSGGPNPLAVVVVICVILFAFIAALSNQALSVNAETDGVVPDKTVLEAYAKSQYEEAFGNSEGYENNVIIVFLANKSSDRYYCTAYLGNNVRDEIVNVFGPEPYPFGSTMENLVPRYYANKLTANFRDVMMQMKGSIKYAKDEGGFDSIFIDPQKIEKPASSYVINHTKLDIDNQNLDQGLDDFTKATGLSAVIVVNYMSNVFERESNPYILPIIFLSLLLIALGIFLVIKSVKRKNTMNEFPDLKVNEEEASADSQSDGKSFENENSASGADAKNDTEKEHAFNRNDFDEKELRRRTKEAEKAEKQRQKMNKKYGRGYDKSRYNKK